MSKADTPCSTFRSKIWYCWTLSLESCAAATGIPVAVLRRAKGKGCSALRGNQVQLASFLQWWYASPAPTDFSYEQERAQQMLLQNVKLKVALQQLKRQLVPATEVYRLGAELGAIRKMLTRLHRIAPSLEGLSEEVIEKRLKEQEEESLAQLGIMDERLKAWQAAAVEG